MKTNLLLLAVIAPLIFSCSNDDDSVNNPVNNPPVSNNQNMILGKWEAKSFTEEYYINGEIFNHEEAGIGAEDVIGTIFEFKADNQFTLSSYDSDAERWIIENGTYTYNVNQSKINYTLVDSDGDSYTETMNVTSLSQNQFKFNMFEEMEDEGVTYSFKININCDRKN